VRFCIVFVGWVLSICWIIQDTTVAYGDVKIQLNSSEFIYAHQPIECRSNLVAIVTSATGNREHRDVIRRTWGRDQNVYFVLGNPRSKKQQTLIDTEAVEHDDIVQGSFEDIYRHLTFKTVFGYLWTRDQCNASYIVKVEDDCNRLSMLSEHGCH
jgi:Galactosyltransferase